VFGGGTALARSPVGRLDRDDGSKREADVVLRSRETHVRRKASVFALSRREQGKILGTETRRPIANAEDRHHLNHAGFSDVASRDSRPIRGRQLFLFCTRTFAARSASKIRSELILAL
jgi:hypothetical protein